MCERLHPECLEHFRACLCTAKQGQASKGEEDGKRRGKGLEWGGWLVKAQSKIRARRGSEDEGREKKLYQPG